MLPDLLALTPFPLVDLAAPSSPTGGAYFDAPAECRRRFSDECRAHYANARLLANQSRLCQCPRGLATYPFNIGDRAFAFTAFIPFPRLGGGREKYAAKKFRDLHVTSEAVARAAQTLIGLSRKFENVIVEAAKKHSHALHEIRKLNRIVKQEAERFCKEKSPLDADQADPRIVRIRKAAEIMSYQFEIIELLANQNLTDLPRHSSISVYKIFDKCVRVYQAHPSGRRLSIRGSGPDAERHVLACDKTFPIIPTVLIENALRYSIAETPITVHVTRSLEATDVCVTNVAPLNLKLDDSVFERGVRASDEEDGSGYGLYVAQLVARQHGTRIELDTHHTEAATECTFRVRFASAPGQ